MTRSCDFSDKGKMCDKTAVKWGTVVLQGCPSLQILLYRLKKTRWFVIDPNQCHVMILIIYYKAFTYSNSLNDLWNYGISSLIFKIFISMWSTSRLLNSVISMSKQMWNAMKWDRRMVLKCIMVSACHTA